MSESNVTGVPESAAAVGRRMQAWQQGRLSGVDSVEILGAVERVVVEAAGALRAVREWCDTADKIVCSHQSEHECVRCDAIRDCATAVRALLPDIPSSAEGVEQVSGTRVTRDDREYPADSGN